MSDGSNGDTAGSTRIRRAAREDFDALGVVPSEWSNDPHVYYANHAHPYRKVLHCVAGSITFHVADIDHVLHPGDRLDLPPHTDHAATVGPDGVVCLEAAIVG